MFGPITNFWTSALFSRVTLPHSKIHAESWDSAHKESQLDSDPWRNHIRTQSLPRGASNALTSTPIIIPLLFKTRTDLYALSRDASLQLARTISRSRVFNRSNKKINKKSIFHCLQLESTNPVRVTRLPSHARDRRHRSETDVSRNIRFVRQIKKSGENLVDHMRLGMAVKCMYEGYSKKYLSAL